MELSVYKIDGTESGKKVVLDENVFGIEPNDHVIYLDVLQYMRNQRQGTSKTKDLTKNSSMNERESLAVTAAGFTVLRYRLFREASPTPPIPRL